MQYVDFAVWQKQWMESEVLEEQLNYWKEQLGDLPVLELPLDRPRPAIQTFNGSSQEIILSESIAQAIKRLNREEGVTLFMTVRQRFDLCIAQRAGRNHRRNGHLATREGRKDAGLREPLRCGWTCQAIRRLESYWRGCGK